jgi:hypothetical protein
MSLKSGVGDGTQNISSAELTRRASLMWRTKLPSVGVPVGTRKTMFVSVQFEKVETG